MADDDWVTVALPRPVVERIDQRLAKDRTYRSRGELVKAFTLRGLDDSEKGAA